MPTRGPPRELTPAFYGCLDWHSDVHGHWLLVRLLRLFPAGAVRRRGARRARAQLHARRTSAPRWPICEARDAPPSSAPTGSRGCWSWRRNCAAGTMPDAPRLVCDARAAGDRGRGAPLELDAEAPLSDPHRRARPDRLLVRADLGLGRRGAARSMRAVLRDAAQRFYRADRNCPLAYEPSGEDFLSPCLAEADFMRRVLAPADFAALAVGLPAADSRATPQRARGLARAGRGHRPRGSQARAHRRAQPEPCLDARGNRARPAAGGCAHARAARRRRAPRGRRAAARHRRALRGRPLARHLRRVPHEPARDLRLRGAAAGRSRSSPCPIAGSRPRGHRSRPGRAARDRSTHRSARRP